MEASMEGYAQGQMGGGSALAQSPEPNPQTINEHHDRLIEALEQLDKAIHSLGEHLECILRPAEARNEKLAIAALPEGSHLGVRTVERVNHVWSLVARVNELDQRLDV